MVGRGECWFSVKQLSRQLYQVLRWAGLREEQMEDGTSAFCLAGDVGVSMGQPSRDVM